MKINSRHLLYAAKKSLWLIPVLAVGLGAVVVMQRGTMADFICGIIPIFVLGIGYFSYCLWRTQKRL